MAAAIPPNGSPLTPAGPRTGPVNPAARAAQQAFFQMALNRAGAAEPSPVAAAVSAAPQVRVEPLKAERVVEAEEPAARLLRPGSLVDITI